MASKIEELKKDIAELDELERRAVRQKVKDILSISKRKLVSEVVQLEEQEKLSPTNVPSSTSSSGATSSASKKYRVKLNNYAWDQTAKFVKFYVTLKDVQNIPAENVTCIFSAKSLELIVSELDNKDYVFNINNLLENIVPENSNWKIKSDMVIINAAKSTANNWSHVTSLEKKAKDAAIPKAADADLSDPSAGIMSLMKNMYNSGDDEMKRTIAKAWSESQSKAGMPF